MVKLVSLCFAMFLYYNIGIWLPWEVVKGQYIAIGQRLDTSDADNLQDCMSRCLRYSENGTECRAVTMATSENKICELLATRNGDEGVVNRTSAAWQTFDRPTWYLGKKKIIYTPSWLHLK